MEVLEIVLLGFKLLVGFLLLIIPFLSFVAAKA